eukprot:1944028-Rhodomonas_salina.2
MSDGRRAYGRQPNRRLAGYWQSQADPAPPGRPGSRTLTTVTLAVAPASECPGSDPGNVAWDGIGTGSTVVLLLLLLVECDDLYVYFYTAA